MDTTEVFLPYASDLGATIIIFVLVWYQNKSALRQHERTMLRDAAMMDTINAQNKAIMECVESDRVRSTPRD
jgi:hypothetical protein